MTTKIVLTASLLLLAGCGGGSSTPAPVTPLVVPPAPPPPTYSLGIDVAGLDGEGLTLLNNGGDSITISASGKTMFPTKLTSGTSYAVTIGKQPSHRTQICTVANGTGTIAAADATSTTVSCVTQRYTVGGTVSGLSGGGLVLQNNHGDDVAIAENGTFMFSEKLPSESRFNIRVALPPLESTKHCTIANQNGTVAGAATTSVEVNCVNAYSNAAYQWDAAGKFYIYAADATSGQLRHRGYLASATDVYALHIYPTRKFAYAVSASNRRVVAYARDDATGELTELEASPFSIVQAGNNFFAAWHPNGKFLFVQVTNGTNTELYEYFVNESTGALVLRQDSPVFRSASSFLFDPDGDFLYVQKGTRPEQDAYPFDTRSGVFNSVSSGTAVYAGRFYEFLGRHAYSVETVNNPGPLGPPVLHIYERNFSDGRLVPVGDNRGQSIINLDRRYGHTVHPSGRYEYNHYCGPEWAGMIPCSFEGDSYDAATGQRVEVAYESLGDHGGFGRSSAMDRRGKFLYQPVLRKAFEIDRATGALKEFVHTESVSFGGTFEPTNRFYYSRSFTNPDELNTYNFDGDKGQITSPNRRVALKLINSALNPVFPLTLGKSTPNIFRSTFAYLVNTTDKTVAAFSLNESNGALANIGTKPSSSSEPLALTLHPNGKFLLTSYDDNSIDVTTVSTQSGALGTKVSSVATGIRPSALAIETSGRFAYVLNQASQTISGYSINARTGALTPLPGASTSISIVTPIAMAIDPSSTFLYVISATNLQWFSLASADGALVSKGTASIPANSSTIVADPTGRFWYVVGIAGIATYTTDGTTGAPTLSGSTAVSGIVSIAMDPTGAYLFAANGPGNSVSSYAIDAITGLLTPIQTSAASGTNVTEVAADYSGRFFYALNRDSKTITRYEIVLSTGQFALGSASDATVGNGALGLQLNNIVR